MNLSHPSNRYRLFLFILILSAVLRLPDLASKSIWGDEATSIYVSLGVTTANDHPPGYYFLSGLAVKLFGLGEFQMRLVSALCGLALVGGILLLGELLSRNWSSFPSTLGLISSLLIAVSPYFIQLSQENRPYSLIAAVTAWSSYFFLLMLERSGTLKNETSAPKGIVGPVIGYSLVTALGICSHLFTWFLMLAQGCFWLLLLFGHPRERRRLLMILPVFFIPIILFLPFLSDSIAIVLNRSGGIQASHSNLSVKYYLTKPLVSSFNFATGYYFMGIRDTLQTVGNIGPKLLLLLFTLIPAIIFLKSLIFQVTRVIKSIDWEPIVYLILGFCISLFGILTIDTSIARQQSISAVLFIPIFGLGLLQFRKFWRGIAFLGYAVVIIISLTYYYQQDTHPYVKTDWRKATEYLQEHYQPGDIVYVAYAEREGYYALRFYGFEQKIVYAKRPHHPENQPTFIDPKTGRQYSTDYILDKLLQQTERLWFIYYTYDSRNFESIQSKFSIVNRQLFGRDLALWLIKKTETDSKRME